MALLLVGCAKQYDDSGIKARIDALETRVNELETSIQGIQSAIGDGVFVQKVDKYVDPDTGITTGITVTYTNGNVVYFTISPANPSEGPVLSVIRNGAGELCWAVDGVIIKIDGKDVPVYQTPEFSIDEEGNLIVEVDGEEVNLGPVTSGGATLQDGIFTDLAVTDEAVVLTLADGSTVNIPFAEPFRLVIEETEYVYEEMGTITIPYTVSGATENTIVGVTGYLPMLFTVDVTDEAIKITPLNPGAQGHLLAYADSRTGLTSIVDIVIEPEMAIIANETMGSYMADSDGDTFEIPVVSNVEIDAAVEEDCDWIHIVGTKAPQYNTLSVKVDANTTGEERTGDIYILKKGTKKIIQFIEFLQPAASIGPKDLSKKGSANCYIVTAKGDYMFAAVKGNSEESVGTVATVEVLWETVNTATAPEAGDIISDFDFDDEEGYVIFTATGEPGNALIAAKDASDNILWSWHIWIPATEIKSSTYGGIVTNLMMDRNLGALVAAEAGESEPDITSHGLFYSWGRKDPFPSPKVGVAGTVSYDGAVMTIAEAIKKPTVYVKTGGDSVKDWVVADEMDNKMWDKTKTIYDPCPVGYVVAYRDKSETFWGGITSAEGYEFNTTYKWFKAGNPATVFSVPGYIDQGSLSNAGTRAYIWSSYASSGDKNIAYQMYVNNGEISVTEQRKSRAGNIRCVAEAVAE